MPRKKHRLYTVGEIFARTAKRFDMHQGQRMALSSSESAQRVAQYVLEQVEIGDPVPLKLIVDEGQTAEIVLRNKDGHTSTFKIEAGSHRLWIYEH